MLLLALLCNSMLPVIFVNEPHLDLGLRHKPVPNPPEATSSWDVALPRKLTVE